LGSPDTAEESLCVVVSPAHNSGILSDFNPVSAIRFRFTDEATADVTPVLHDPTARAAGMA
jgi:hypothetical protein